MEWIIDTLKIEYIPKYREGKMTLHTMDKIYENPITNITQVQIFSFGIENTGISFVEICHVQ